MAPPWPPLEAALSTGAEAGHHEAAAHGGQEVQSRGWPLALRPHEPLPVITPTKENMSPKRGRQHVTLPTNMAHAGGYLEVSF